MSTILMLLLHGRKFSLALQEGAEGTGSAVEEAGEDSPFPANAATPGRAEGMVQVHGGRTRAPVEAEVSKNR